MKFRFRLTLLVVLLGLIALTVTTVGVFSFLNARSAAEELAGQVLEQMALRTEQQVEKLLDEATRQAALTHQLLKSGRPRSDDFPGLVATWRQTLPLAPDLNSVFIALEATGESVGLSRLPGGRLSVRQTRRAAGKLQLREFWLEDHPDRPYRTAPDAPDSRLRPWFVAARDQGHAVWADTYVFLGVGGTQDVPGVTHAVPLYRADHSLEAVLAADFDLAGLCRFLHGLPVGDGGLAFLVELRPGGGRRVIAHPRPELLLGPRPEGGRGLVPAEELADERVRAFLERLPASAEREALRETVRFRAGGRDYLGRCQRVEGEGRPRWLICTVLPEEAVLAHARWANRLTLVITLGALAVAALVGVYVSGQVARPLEHLTREAAAVGQLRIDPGPVAHSFVLEVDRLAVASEEMKAGLRSFRKYVPADLVRALLGSGQEARLGGERRVLTVFFSDIADFTAITESMSGEELVDHLGEYLGALSEEVLAAGGTVDKYIGDALMAFWGAPTPNPAHALAACTAAQRGRQRLARLRPACHTRFGIHTGEVVVGNIGSANRLNYTVIGDAVNLASRLEGLNKVYGTEALISEETHRQAGDAVVARPLDWVAVKGRTRPVLVCELLGLSGELSRENDADNRRALAAALGRLQDRQATPLLADLLTDPRQPLAVRQAAAEALASLGTAPALAHLRALLKAEAGGALRAQALVALGRAGAIDGLSLAPFLSHRSAALRVAALQALQARGSAEPELARAVLPLLDDKAPSVRDAAIAAAGALNLRAAIPRLVSLAADESTRAQALTGLTQLPDPRGLDAYLAGLTDRNPDLRRACRRALLAVRDLVGVELERRVRQKKVPDAALPAVERVLTRFTPLRDWQVVGPFARTNPPLFQGDEPIDFAAAHTGPNGVTVRWHPRRGEEGGAGRVLLEPFKAGAGDRGGFGYDASGSPDLNAYAYAAIDAPAERDALLLVGSSGSVAVRLNGREVHNYSHFAGRAYAADSDLVRVRLRQGANRLVVHSRQGIGAWCFSVQVSGPTQTLFAVSRGPSALEDLRAFALKNDGSAERGARLFLDSRGVGCVKCHAVGGKGGNVGPDLDGLAAKYDRAEIIASVLEPSQRIATGYQPVLVATTRGKVLTGLVREETADHLDLVDADGKVVRVKKADIDERRVSDVSIMPVGLVDTLRPEEFADLVSYLLSLRQPAPPAKR
jgi:putative heme-binding domain-containing protein